MQGSDIGNDGADLGGLQANMNDGSNERLLRMQGIPSAAAAWLRQGKTCLSAWLRVAVSNPCSSLDARDEHR